MQHEGSAILSKKAGKARFEEAEARLGAARTISPVDRNCQAINDWACCKLCRVAVINA